jgi:hypothetical protein
MYTKFILWNDVRAVETYRNLNNNPKLNLITKAASLASYLFPNERFKQASKYHVEMIHVS